MKLLTTLLLLLCSVLTASSQQTEKKYQGLLWEITGKGMIRPSYLFGTMHVSNKLAFHLADSFYTAIKSVDVVALETNPANWQEDYSSLSGLNAGYAGDAYSMFNMPSDYLHKNTFAIDKYEYKLKLAMATEPAMVNGMLYRTFNAGADFEEDTYLDMYIFQTGSKLGKKLTGVENFVQSEKLVTEAYKDAAKEKRTKSYDSDNGYDDYVKNPFSIEDAYRRGDLDMMDSLEEKQFNSKAFLEKFLYKRNEIQANSIDSIIRSKRSLFVGVGSAHLPGKRGVIEMLRSKGYKLRAVKMGQRNGRQKDIIDKKRVSVNFKTVKSEDESFSVEIPGDKFYTFNKFSDLNTRQFADMGNGAYYVISRVKTNGLLLGDNESQVYKKLDSMLYENIPGKILKRTPVVKNGYKGFDIINRTRRGDVQRYNFFITPFEVLIFKVSGTGDYVINGEEANRFFNSVKFTSVKENGWMHYKPATGGFEIQLPHMPLLQKDVVSNRLEYTATDKKDNNTYFLLKTSLHNYGFIEQDSFDLNLMEESYASSEMVEKQISRVLGKWQGYPALDCKYKHKDGSYSRVRYLLQGAIYFAQGAHYTTETESVKHYFNSFKIVSFIYPEVQLHTDTSMHFNVHSPLFPSSKKQDELAASLRSMMEDYSEYAEDLIPEFATTTIGNDTIGEKIFVAYAKLPKNTYIKDSLEIFGRSELGMGSDKMQSYIYLKKDSGVTAGGLRYLYQQVSDTNSSRTIISKIFYKLGNYFVISTLTDTLTAHSSLLKNFIETFTPMDTLKGESPFVKRNDQFFKDFVSSDSTTHAKAIKRLANIEFDVTDVPAVKKIIDTLTWGSKDYLQLKQSMIIKLGDIKDTSITGYLKRLYVAAKDTADLQNNILQTLLSSKTKKAFIAFKDLIIAEPPVIAATGSKYNNYHDIVYNATKMASRYNSFKNNDNYNSSSWALLYDSLSLAKEIFPDILQLINLDDYKMNVMELLTTLVDSGYVKVNTYEPYISKFYLEARQELKKEKAFENQNAIAKAEKANKAEEGYSHTDNTDAANELLQRYAVLLLPYWDKNPGIATFFNDIMKLQNKEIRFKTMVLLLRNKKPVNDSLLNFYAADDNYRINLYRQLKKAALPHVFPAKYNNQQDMVKSILTNAAGYEKYDTLALLDKLPVIYKNKKGLVYFYKYKTRKEEKKWKIIYFGVQPDDTKNFDDDADDLSAAIPYNYDYTASETNRLNESKPVKEQLLELLKVILNKTHRSAMQFYNAREIDKDTLSEQVKANRFGE
jgi:uncharacterized protein YbaP (TraB family)